MVQNIPCRFGALSFSKKINAKEAYALWHWRWEFLRRNKDYRREFESFQSKYKKFFLRYGSPWVDIYSVKKLPASAKASFDFARWFGMKSEVDRLCAKWQIAYPTDPAYCERRLRDCTGGRRWSPANPFAFGIPSLLGIRSCISFPHDPALPIGAKRIDIDLNDFGTNILAQLKRIIRCEHAVLRASGAKIVRSKRGRGKNRSFVELVLADAGNLERLPLKVDFYGPQATILKQTKFHLQKALRRYGAYQIRRTVERNKRRGSYRFYLQVWDLRQRKKSFPYILRRLRPEHAMVWNSQADRDRWLKPIAYAYKCADKLINGGFREIT